VSLLFGHAGFGHQRPESQDAFLKLPEMPDDIGAMFSTGEMPWHGKGLRLEGPATMKAALVAGGLDWQVGYDELVTKGSNPSPVPSRRAVARLDKLPGDEGRVIGVVHRGFEAIQNSEAAQIFDNVFGKGKAVYETGGYLRRGEVIWLLAKIDRTISVGGKDNIVPYAFMLNSHDGSSAYQIRLTTIRVVCQNTLNAALKESKFGKQFRRSHSGSVAAHAIAADEFYKQALGEIDAVELSFNLLLNRPCDDANFEKFTHKLFPEPKRPAVSAAKSQQKAYETRLRNTQAARAKVRELRDNGQGTEIAGVRGSLWGALNAVIEYSDFHSSTEGPVPASVLLGDGASFKTRAYQLAMSMTQSS